MNVMVSVSYHADRRCCHKELGFNPLPALDEFLNRCQMMAMHQTTNKLYACEILYGLCILIGKKEDNSLNIDT